MVIRKVVYDSFNNNFFVLGQKAKQEWENKPAKGSRRSTVPNTAFGKALTVGAQLDAIKIYEDEQAEKAAAKVRALTLTLSPSRVTHTHSLSIQFDFSMTHCVRDSKLNATICSHSLVNDIMQFEKHVEQMINVFFELHYAIYRS